MSIFSGVISELPNICVDNFTNLECSAYFLTHVHTDHTKGLKDKGFVELLRTKSDIFLYCSPITKLVISQFKELSNVLDKVRELNYTTNGVGIPQTETYDSYYHVMVSPVPAGHCPGSVMFLFETASKRILYTGDIRIAEGDTKKFKQLHDGKTAKSIDCIYLDVTFLSESYWHFPPRDKCIRVVVDEIEEYLAKGPKYSVKLMMTSHYGQEAVIMAVAEAMRCKIHVPKRMFHVYSHVPEVISFLTNDCSTTKIHADWKGSKEHCVTLDSNVLQIFPTAQAFRCKKDCEPELKRWVNSNHLKVNFSSHSSGSAIKDFVSYLRPKRCFPCTPAVHSSDAQRDSILEEIMSEFDTVESQSQRVFTKKKSVGELVEIQSKKRFRPIIPVDFEPSPLNSSSEFEKSDEILAKIELDEPVAKKSFVGEQRFKPMISTDFKHINSSNEFEKSDDILANIELDEPVAKNSFVKESVDILWKKPFRPIMPTELKPSPLNSSNECEKSDEILANIALNEPVTELGSKQLNECFKPMISTAVKHSTLNLSNELEKSDEIFANIALDNEALGIQSPNDPAHPKHSTLNNTLDSSYAFEKSDEILANIQLNDELVVEKSSDNVRSNVGSCSIENGSKEVRIINEQSPKVEKSVSESLTRSNVPILAPSGLRADLKIVGNPVYHSVVKTQNIDASHTLITDNVPHGKNNIVNTKNLNPGHKNLHNNNLEKQIENRCYEIGPKSLEEAWIESSLVITRSIDDSRSLFQDADFKYPATSLNAEVFKANSNVNVSSKELQCNISNTFSCSGGTKSKSSKNDSMRSCSNAFKYFENHHEIGPDMLESVWKETSVANNTNVNNKTFADSNEKYFLVNKSPDAQVLKTSNCKTVYKLNANSHHNGSFSKSSTNNFSNRNYSETGSSTGLKRSPSPNSFNNGLTEYSVVRDNIKTVNNSINVLKSDKKDAKTGPRKSFFIPDSVSEIEFDCSPPEEVF